MPDSPPKSDPPPSSESLESEPPPKSPNESDSDFRSAPETAKAENSFSRSWPWHLGQEGFSVPKTRVSKRLEHLRHVYS